MRACEHLCLNMFVWSFIFGSFLSLSCSTCCMQPIIITLAVCAEMCVPLNDVCVCACVCVQCMCTAVLLHGLAGECSERMIRLGAHQGCSAITQGLWGIWSCSAFQGCLQLGSSPPRSPHTHHFNCLCFFHYFYCLSSALRAPWACGKVIVMAAVCFTHSLLLPPLAVNGCVAQAGELSDTTE